MTDAAAPADALAAAEATAPEYPGDGMVILGAILWVAGLMTVAVSFLLPTSAKVPFEARMAAIQAGIDAPREVTNLAAQQQQLMIALVGGLIFIAGVLVHCTGIHVREFCRAMKRPKRV